MNTMISALTLAITTMLTAVYTSLCHNWAALSVAILMACAIKVYVNSQKLTKFLLRKSKVSVAAAVLLGTFTPFCACGTMAVILGMLSTTLPWGPVMAFLTSSPLMSPNGFILIAGMISLRFAIALTAASLVIGLGSGFLTLLIEKKTNFLTNQNRFKDAPKPKLKAEPEPSCGCSGGQPDSKGSDHISVGKPGSSVLAKWKLDSFFSTLWTLGFRQILVNFAVFVAIGSLINLLIPSSIIQALFGGDHFWSVPLASVIGLPLYITTESSVPIIQSMLQSGASEGSMLAFIITGSATSAWVIAGLNTFMRKRAILLYVGFVLTGGILCGYLYNLFIALS